MGGLCRSQWLFSRISAETARESAGPPALPNEDPFRHPDGGVAAAGALMLELSKKDPESRAARADRLPDGPYLGRPRRLFKGRPSDF